VGKLNILFENILKIKNCIMLFDYELKLPVTNAIFSLIIRFLITVGEADCMKSYVGV
jgi:hypothetical protein